MDAGEPPNQDAIRRAWDATVSAPEHFQETGRELVKEMTGRATPSSVVQSAEGITQFDGLYHNRNGVLSEVARAALRNPTEVIQVAGLQEPSANVAASAVDGPQASPPQPA